MNLRHSVDKGDLPPALKGGMLPPGDEQTGPVAQVEEENESGSDTPIHAGKRQAHLAEEMQRLMVLMDGIGSQGRHSSRFSVQKAALVA
jgi:hypothetical protein